MQVWESHELKLGGITSSYVEHTYKEKGKVLLSMSVLATDKGAGTDPSSRKEEGLCQKLASEEDSLLRCGAKLVETPENIWNKSVL